jgi:hypothetical protein
MSEVLLDRITELKRRLRVAQAKAYRQKQRAELWRKRALESTGRRKKT